MLSLLSIVFILLSEPDDSQDIFLQKGADYYNAGKYDSCIIFFKQVVKENPSSKDGYFNLGAAFGRLRKYDEAVDCFSKAILLNPGDLEALYQLGATYIVKEDYKAAAVVYTRIISITPTSPRAYEDRGTAYWKLNLQNQSRADLIMAKRLRRGETVTPPKVNVQTSVVSKNVKLPDIAIEDTIHADPADRELLPYIGEIYMTTEDYDLAVIAYSKLIKLSPDNPKGYKNRALAYDKLGRPDKAKKDRDKLQKLLGTPAPQGKGK